MRKLTVLVLSIAFLFTARCGSARETVKIGVIFAKTGKAAVTNRHYFNAARLAKDEINRSGGLRIQ
jgi:ABC-type branched-subunit amino acid transport system substrate-binding protein